VYDQAFEVFFEDYDESPVVRESSADSALLVTLALLLVIDASSSTEPAWAVARVLRFSDRLLSVVNRHARSFLVPVLRSFEVLCNRFATAKFEVDPLLEDFRQVLAGVRGSFPFPLAVNGYVMCHLTSLLDAKLLNKLIANPSRFNFTNAVAWNTFITAMYSVEDLDFRLLKQTVSVMMMAHNMTNPQTANGLLEVVCPDLDPKLVFYLLKNFQTDPLMPEPINYRVFADLHRIPDIPSVQAVVAMPVVEFRMAAKELALPAWNRVLLTPAIERLYPFFRAFVAAQ
jgi:hypothetical protein